MSILLYYAELKALVLRWILIHTAKEIAGDMLKDGKVSRGFLGLIHQEITINRRIINYYRLESDRGLFVVDLEPNSPAVRAGVLKGDIIVQFDNNDISDSSTLFRQLSKDTIGKVCLLRAIRGTQLKELSTIPQRRLMD